MEPRPISTIILPVRPQVDTLIAIFILKNFAEAIYPGIKNAGYSIMSGLPEGETGDTMEQKGAILLDIGGGKFDHHGKEIKTTASELVAEFLQLKEDPALQKLLELAKRDDFFGKGTISEDALDRAFGFSGLLAAVNKTNAENTQKTVETFLPLIEAHFKEEVRRTKELPLEVENQIKANKATMFAAKQRDKKLKIIIIESDNPSLSGFLRSRLGGGYDVVAQVRTTGHVNILTRPAKRIDLRALAALIRAEEQILGGLKENANMPFLARPGKIDSVPEWYYDTATNSIQNGGTNFAGTNPTRIPKFSLQKILEVGLSEQIWSPIRR